MSKFIQLIDINEIKAFRITCVKCGKYWAGPVSLGKNKIPNICNYCNDESKTLFPKPHAERIEKLLHEIKWAQSGLNGFQISFELETETQKPLNNRI